MVSAQVVRTRTATLQAALLPTWCRIGRFVNCSRLVGPQVPPHHRHCDTPTCPKQLVLRHSYCTAAPQQGRIAAVSADTGTTCRSFGSRLLVKDGYRRSVGAWLIVSAGSIGTMVLFGGYTRLTESGLSMTDWTFAGRRLPCNSEAWVEEFDKYKKTPEYEKVHFGIQLEEFKRIYFIEWFHRMLGRFTGLVFASGLAYFAVQRVLSATLLKRCFCMLGIGGMQGVVGWWMVKSGLGEPTDASDVPRVSPYRLAVHLLTAMGLYSAVFWNALTLLRSQPRIPALPASTIRSLCNARTGGIGVAALLASTLLTGALVAGIDAGRAFNTWPKMLGRWVPEEMWNLKNWTDLTENTAVVQFDHRTMAYTTVIASSALFLYVLRIPNLPPTIKFAAHLLPATSFMQMLLGIGTLMMHVPPYMGVLHQGGAMATLTALLYYLHTLALFLPSRAITRLPRVPI